MFDNTHIKQAFGKAAPTYDNAAELQGLILADALALAAPHWPKSGHIIDIGCGTGQLVSQAEKQSLSLNFTGIDLAFGMCLTASKKLPVAAAHADRLPFADASFDGAISSLMLQWSPDPLVTLREMHRVLKPHSVCVVTSFTDGTLKELRETFASIDAAPHITPFISPMQLTAFAAHAGFALLHAEQETFTEYYTAARSLMRNIKAIGATNKLTGRNKGLMTPRTLDKLEARYKEHFGHKKKGLPATWNAITLLLEKRP